MVDPDNPTLREICDEWIGWECPEECLTFTIDLLRTMLQREPSTFEGCCASYFKWLELFGPVTQEKVKHFVENLGSRPGAIADLPIPISIIQCMMDAQDADELNAVT